MDDMLDEINVLNVAPGKTPEPASIANTLHAMQELVGGYIEIGPLDDVCLVCNEEGKLMGMEGNRRIGSDIIAGPFFLCSAPSDSDHFESLTEEQLEQYTKRFFSVEYFVGGESK